MTRSFPACGTIARRFAGVCAILTVGVLAAQAQPPATPDQLADGDTFEELPELQASEILRPELLQGPHFQVREPVPTSSGTNQFVIDSDYGVFEADGNEMLLRRIREIGAITQLKEVSRTDQFKNSLAAAARGPISAAKNIVTDPVNTISNVPKGVMKFMGRVGDSVKNVGKQSEGKDPQGNKAEQMIGYSSAKRKLAISLGVDPYSTNTVLQKELNEIAWASYAGGFLFKAATLPIGGAAGAVLSVTGASNSLTSMLSEKSPADLKALNRQALTAMGTAEKDVNRFLGNNNFSPTAQTAFVLNLKTLDNVANRPAFVRAAAENSDSEADAAFCVLTSALMAKIHKGEKPLARIVMLGDRFPIAIAQDGAVVIALQWDYAAWTFGASQFVQEIQKIPMPAGGNKVFLVALSGQVSSRLKQELEARGFGVRDRVTPGPLK